MFKTEFVGFRASRRVLVGKFEYALSGRLVVDGPDDLVVPFSLCVQALFDQSGVVLCYLVFCVLARSEVKRTVLFVQSVKTDRAEP